MSKVILIAMFVSGIGAIAENAPQTTISIKSFTVANGQATLVVKADGSDVALIGPMTQAPQLRGANGRLLANCASIGSQALECEIGYDGGAGQLAIFKQKDSAGYTLANSNVVLSDGGSSFKNLVKVQNGRGLSPEATVDSVIRATANANSIDRVISALQAEPRVQPSDAVLHAPPVGHPPAGRPPVVVAPPIAYGPPAGTHHSRHEEHHRDDTVIDENDSSVPVIQETQSSVTCIDGRCLQYGQIAGPGIGPCGGPPCGGPPLPPPCGGPPCGAVQLPGAPVIVGPPPGPVPTPYYGGQPYYPPQPYYQGQYYPPAYPGPVVVDRYYRGPVRMGMYQGQNLPPPQQPQQPQAYYQGQQPQGGDRPLPQPYNGPEAQQPAPRH